MDPSKIKSNLKDAREAIKQKDFKTAINLCKAVLSADRNNYGGLVLLGAAIQETEQRDQAEKAFKKAISISPNQILAYQGLSSYYEKNTARTRDQDKELVNTYQQLLALETDGVKYCDLCTKLSNVATKALGTEGAVAALTSLQPVETERQQVINKSLLNVLMQDKDLSTNLENKLETLLERNVKDVTNNADLSDCYKRYLKLLYKSKKISLLVSEAQNCHLILPSAEFPLEWLCKVYSEQVANEDPRSLSDSEMIECFNKLLTLNPHSTMALMAKGAQLYIGGDFYEASQVMKQVTVSGQVSYAWIYLCRCFARLHCQSDAVISSRRAIAAVERHEPNNERLLNLLKLELADALSRQNTNEASAEAVTMCDQLLQSLPNHPELTIILTRALLRSGSSHSRVHELLVEHERNSAFSESQSVRLQAMYLREKHKLVEAENILRSAVARQLDDYELWLMLGEVYCDLGKDEPAMQALLKATKLSPHCSTCYLRLGQLYRRGERDVDKSRRCYLKALQLNPQLSEAAQGLADVYNILGNRDGCVQLLRAATRQSGAAKWAWLQLGMLQLGDKDYEQAITSLVAAIRADPNDSHCWSALGDAYAARGSFNSALKSYQRVIELDGRASYPLLQVAHIKLKLGLLEEAAQQFSQLGQSDVGYVPALKGLAETYLRQARSSLARQLFGRAKILCQQTLDVIARAITVRRDVSCLWKLIGDTLLVASHLPRDICLVVVPAISEDGTETASLSIAALLELGARCYCRALSLCSEVGSLAWHDLATNYLTQAAIVRETPRKALLNSRALAAAKKAVQLDSNSWQHWNILGIVSASQDPPNYRLAQHAFIRSVQTTGSNPVPWTNLGVIYLSVGAMKLANQAFRQAQRAEPGYVEAWIGQAMIAELTKNDDAMDLFRHTTELGVHRESCVGYASWVCSTLQQETCRDYAYVIEKMHAVSVATDSLTWYTALVLDNSCAFNMLGMLLERQGQHGRAALAFESALGLLDEDKRLDAVRTNYARVLVELGRCNDAIQQYQLIKTASFTTQCGLALAYFKAEMYEESHGTYESALHWLAPSDAFKSHVLVAMAAMTYMFQGMEEAQTLLYQCITLKPASVQGLFAMCSLGLLHSDINLSQLVLTELNSYKQDSAYITDIAVFNAFIHYIQNESVEAIRVLSSYTHRHPGCSGLWLALALLLLNGFSTDRARAAGRCANVAITLGRGSLDVSKIMFVVSLSELVSGKGMASLRSSQKAVHMYPGVAENWAVLIAACHSRHQDVKWLGRVIEHVRKQMTTSRPLGKWLGNYERVLVQETAA